MGNLLSAFRGHNSSDFSDEMFNPSNLKSNLLEGQVSLSILYPSIYLKLEAHNSSTLGLPDPKDDDALCKDLSNSIEKGSKLLERISRYKGSSALIKAAITTPNNENETAALKSIIPMILLLKDCYLLSCEIESHIPRVLSVLFQSNGNPDSDNLYSQGSIVALKFAKIMDYSFQFDTLKMGLTDIQNDLSYYRRMSPKLDQYDLPENNDSELSTDITNYMSLFYAYHNPMIKIIVDQTQRTISSYNKPDFLQSLAILSAGVINSVKKGVPNMQLYLYIRILMTTCIIYDWISDHGVFVSSSKIPILEVVTLILQYTNANATGYLVSIQLGCKNFNDPNTPLIVKSAFV
ncbi:Protein FAM49-like protein [Smittium mucronatum]|uniref:Protein FAM49-like protein n=1 Tax=Smittium mucronatum TaxID=133383 RepID=A0A1R0GU12_9FUNG|nr:Protein FAM49-like protein [Smittium mucronatum]